MKKKNSFETAFIKKHIPHINDGEYISIYAGRSTGTIGCPYKNGQWFNGQFILLNFHMFPFLDVKCHHISTHNPEITHYS